jgi:hypothetical protein
MCQDAARLLLALIITFTWIGACPEAFATSPQDTLPASPPEIFPLALQWRQEILKHLSDPGPCVSPDPTLEPAAADFCLELAVGEPIEDAKSLYETMCLRL